MSEQPTAPVVQMPLPRALGLTLAVGAIGWGTDRIAAHAGWRFPSVGYLVGELVWKLATIGVLAWALRRYEGRRLDGETTGFSDAPDASRRPYPLATAGVVLIAAVVLSATVGHSAGQASAYGKVHPAGFGLILAEVLIRYPLNVFAEEAFFRGWLQPRLGANGPVLAAVLWGAYHLQQVSTIPSLVLLGLGLGALRWWQGHVRSTAAVHYVADVVFFLTTYT